MLLRIQCVVPHPMGTNVAPPLEEDWEAEEIKERVAKREAVNKQRLIENFQLVDSNYLGVKRIASSHITDDGEKESTPINFIFEYANFIARDEGLEVNAPICIVNFYLYGKTGEDVYEYLNSNNWILKLDEGVLNLKLLRLCTPEGHYNCSITDLDAPVGFEHPDLFKAFVNQQEPYTLYSPRELLSLAFNFNPSFYEEVIHSDYVSRAQDVVIRNEWVAPDDLAILRDEYNFVKGDKSDYTWSVK